MKLFTFKTLTLRIYLTVVAVLLLFAGVSGWLFQRHIQEERVRAESVVSDRMSAWADLIQRSLPGANAPVDEQRIALHDWASRLRLPLALDSRDGERIAASEAFLRREGQQRAFAMALEDGRTLWVMRPGRRRAAQREAADGPNLPSATAWRSAEPRDERERARGARRTEPLGPWSGGVGWAVLLVLLFFAIAGVSWPVARALTRRLATLKLGVERFGSGQLSHRVDIGGEDEVAAVASSFNQAAERVEALVRSHQNLLANASHELRSPLARLKMAITMLDGAGPAQRERLQREIDTNIAELDALVEEVLLASRLDAAADATPHESVDLLALAVEEAARVDAQVQGPAVQVPGDERLLRRAVRNLLENARRYGGGQIDVRLAAAAGAVELAVCDRGPGVPAAARERIFEPFYRLPGHAEQAGGVGLGLSLVRQIAQRHRGSVRCEARTDGGSCFILSLPVEPTH